LGNHGFPKKAHRKQSCASLKSVLLLVLIEDFNETKILAGKGHWLVVLLRKTKEGTRSMRLL